MTAAGAPLRDLLEDLWGCSVLDRDGDRVGSFEEAFYDRHDEPEWLGVGVGLLGRRIVLVPADGMVAAGFAVQVPYTADTIRDAPELPSDDLDAGTRDTVRAFYARISLDPS